MDDLKLCRWIAFPVIIIVVLIAFTMSRSQAPSTPSAPPAGPAIADKWPGEEALYQANLARFSGGLSAAQLVDIVHQDATASGISQYSVSSSPRPSAKQLYRLNELTLVFQHTTPAELKSFTNLLKAKAPGVIVEELTMAPETLDPNFWDGNIRIASLEIGPSAATATAIPRKEDLLKQFQKYAAYRADPMDRFQQIDGMRPANIVFNKTRVFNGNQMTISCVTQDPRSAGDFVRKLADSKLVTVDMDKLQMVQTIRGTTFQLNVTFNAMAGPTPVTNPATNP